MRLPPPNAGEELLLQVCSLLSRAAHQLTYLVACLQLHCVGKEEEPKRYGPRAVDLGIG